MKTHCPKCGAPLKFSDKNLGKHGKCPNCHRDIIAEPDAIAPPLKAQIADESPASRRVLKIAWGSAATFAICAVTFVLYDLIAHSAPAPVVAPLSTLTVGQPAAAPVQAPQTASPFQPPTAVPAAQTTAPPSMADASAAQTTGRAPQAPSLMPTGQTTTPDQSPATSAPGVGTTPTGKTIYEGPRGGLYHYSKNGKKVYEKHRR